MKVSGTATPSTSKLGERSLLEMSSASPKEQGGGGGTDQGGTGELGGGTGGTGGGPSEVPRKKIVRREKKEEEGSEDEYTKYKNPFCVAEAEASMRCMADNGHDRQRCLKVFQLYRDCKKAHRDAEREKVRNQPLF